LLNLLLLQLFTVVIALLILIIASPAIAIANRFPICCFYCYVIQ